MSTRNHLIDETEQTLRRRIVSGDPVRNIAESVVNTLLPLITEEKQLLGVPEGSVLYVPYHDDTFFFTWRDGRLNNLGGGGGFTPEYILRWGHLTVVWMP